MMLLRVVSTSHLIGLFTFLKVLAGVSRVRGIEGREIMPLRVVVLQIDCRDLCVVDLHASFLLWVLCFLEGELVFYIGSFLKCHHFHEAFHI